MISSSSPKRQELWNRPDCDVQSKGITARPYTYTQHINQLRALLAQQKAQHPPMGTEDEKVTPWGIGRLYTVIPGRLSFSVHLNDEMTIDKIKAHPDLFFFSSYCQDEYTPFCRDFGPVNLGVVHRFCQYMRDKLNHPQLKNRHL
eukprot:3554036-Rhodomonas_salina.2